MDKADLLELLYGSDESHYLFQDSEESYRMLLAALDLGWQVEEPVYLRYRWDKDGERIFQFILIHHSREEPILLTTRQTPDIERLVIEERWQVN
jgi:hypothetical protein